MRLTIGRYTLEKTDEYNITLTVLREGKNPKTKEPVTTNARLGYYGNMEGALKKLLNEEISNSDAESVQDLLKAIEEAHGMIERGIKELEKAEAELEKGRKQKRNWKRGSDGKPNHRSEISIRRNSLF
jgi:hypothetical protein